MPQRFDKMVETQTAILEDIKGIREEQNGLRKTTNSLLKTQTAILEDIKGSREEQTALRKTHEADHKENVQAMHGFRGNYAVDAATKNTVGLAKHFCYERLDRALRRTALETVEQVSAEQEGIRAERRAMHDDGCAEGGPCGFCESVYLSRRKDRSREAL